MYSQTSDGTFCLNRCIIGYEACMQQNGKGYYRCDNENTDEVDAVNPSPYFSVFV